MRKGGKGSRQAAKEQPCDAGVNHFLSAIFGVHARRVDLEGNATVSLEKTVKGGRKQRAQAHRKKNTSKRDSQDKGKHKRMTLSPAHRSNAPFWEGSMAISSLSFFSFSKRSYPHHHHPAPLRLSVWQPGDFFGAFENDLKG
jgi:hypothetical protein